MSILLLTAFFLVIVYLMLLFTRKPRGFVPFNKRIQVDQKEYPNPINRDRYLTKKLPQQSVETVVIGSGISGMAAASVLSRVGRSCLVLEHHYVAGGWTHQFKNNGYEFETGVHYLPKLKIDPFDLVMDSPIEYSELGKDSKEGIFDKIYFQGEEYCIPHKFRNFIKMLCEKFPHQQKEIKNFFDIKQLPKGQLVYMMRAFSRLINSKLVTNFIQKYFVKDVKLGEAFEKHKITDFKLKSLLCYMGYLIEIDNDVTEMVKRASYYVYLIIIFSYCQGAVFPLKGSEEIANRILPVVYKNGNKVLVDKKVKRIVLNKTNDKVIGVQMENDDIIQCKNVISSIGIAQTYEQLLPEQFQNDPEYQYFQKHANYQKSVLILFVGLKGKAGELKLPSHNIFHLPDSGFSQSVEKHNNLNDVLNSKNVLYYISSATGKQYKEVDFDKCTLTILATVGGDKELFTKWENQSTNHRDQDYQDFKTKFTEKALNEAVFKYLPQLKNKIEFVSVGTALTVENYMNAKNGTIYGLQATKNLDQDEKLYNFMKYSTKIKGLYLTGQDLIGPGIQPNLIGGVLTASKVLGYWTKWDILSGRQFFIDFWNLLKSDKTKYVQEVTLAKKQD